MKQESFINGIHTIIEIKDNNFKIGNYCDLKMIMTNLYGNSFEATVQMKKGWSQKDLHDIIKSSVMLCEAKVIKIHALFNVATSLN